MPRYAYLSSGGDVRLLLDLDNEQHVELLRREVNRPNRGTPVLLQEPLPGLEDAWLPGPGGHYMVEVVVSLTREGVSAGKAPDVSPIQSDRDPSRMVTPGEDWLFFKLYCNPETEEDLLTEAVTSFVEEAARASLPSEFFFVRYSDPDPHLRIRFRTPAPDDTNVFLPKLFALGRQLMDHDLCVRFAVDTYERETERYGGSSAIAFAEDLFVSDSALVLQLLRLLKETGLSRETVAALTALDLLEGLTLDEGPLLDVVSRLRPMRQAAGRAFREFKLAHHPAITLREFERPLIRRLLESRRTAAGEMGRQLRRLASERRLSAPIASICTSLLHMHCNRFVGRDRAEELKCLGLMIRIFESRQALAEAKAAFKKLKH